MPVFFSPNRHLTFVQKDGKYARSVFVSKPDGVASPDPVGSDLCHCHCCDPEADVCTSLDNVVSLETCPPPRIVLPSYSALLLPLVLTTTLLLSVHVSNL